MKVTVEVSRAEANPWSTIVVRRGPHLLFSASHRDVITAFRAVLQGVECVCVFHGDALQDVQGRFFLGYKPTVCTTYDVTTIQSTTLVLHNIVPYHIESGLDGIYVFGERAAPLKHQPNMHLESSPYGLKAVHDAWWMDSPLSVRPITIPAALTTNESPALNARLIGEWTSHGQRIVLAVTYDGFLRLATTTIVEAIKTVSWRWISVGCPLSLNVDGRTCVTIAENSDSLDNQVIFVFSESSQKIAVYRLKQLGGQADSDATEIELLSIIPSSCAAVSVQLYPESFVQPLVVVRGWNLELYCPYTISQSQECHPFASLQLSSIDLHEGIIEVLSVFQASVRTVVAPSMEVRIVDIPNLSLRSRPELDLILTTMSFVPGLSMHRSYELLRWLLAGLWQCVNDGKSYWCSWHAVSEQLKRLIIQAVASPERFSCFCAETKLDIEATNSKSSKEVGSCAFESALFNTDNTSDEDLALFLDPSCITSASISTAPPREFYTFVWNTSAGEHSLQDQETKIVEMQWTRNESTAFALAVHTLFESVKLQPSLWGCLVPLGNLLADLFAILGMQKFVRYHTTILCKSESCSAVLRTFNESVDVGSWIPRDLFGNNASKGVPFDYNSILSRVLDGKGDEALQLWPRLDAPPLHPIGVANATLQLFQEAFAARRSDEHRFRHSWWMLLAEAVVRRRFTPEMIRSRLAIGPREIIQRALHLAKENVHSLGDHLRCDEMFETIERFDLMKEQTTKRTIAHQERELIKLSKDRAIGKLYSANLIDDDGVNMDAEFSKLWDDTRLEVVQALLNTATPIPLPGRGDGSDMVHSSLKATTRKTLALPLGRGMLTLSSRNFRVRDVIPVPPLNLEGRTSDGIMISNDITQSATAAETLLWPSFHNGCAAGLRFLPLGGFSANGTPLLSRHWVVYQTRGSQNMPAKAGLLYAAGLLGHLRSLQLTDIYSLLTSSMKSSQVQHANNKDPQTLAVILGLSCSFRGTHNDVVYRCLTVHVQSLTPTNADLDVSIEVQTGALFAIGLLCQGSENPFLVDVLLNEMARLPSDEHCKHRKGYVLAAGCSLGLILLGKGRHGIPGIDDRLLALLAGGKRCMSKSVRGEGVVEFEELASGDGHFLTRALLHRVSCPTPPPCNRVLESDNYNVSVCGAGAIMALGFMYLKTNDAIMAEKLAPTDTVVGMESIFPEHALLRTCVAGLVMWKRNEASRDYLYSCVPSCLLTLHSNPRSDLAPVQVRYLMMNMGHCIAGAALAMGLRYVGSMSIHAKATILGELKGFLSGYIGTSGVPMTPVQKSSGAFDQCIASCAVALSLVMAGTGDAVCLQLLRKMLKRNAASFGNHMAVSMALGLLFLGGGKVTLSNSLPSIAALLIAFFPTWPKDFTDNSAHLQILRHMYVLAAESRFIQTVDAQTNQPVSMQLRVTLNQPQMSQEENPFRGNSHLWTPQPASQAAGTLSVSMLTPTLLPDLQTITSMELRSANHYTLSIHSLEGFRKRCTRGEPLIVKVQSKVSTYLCRSQSLNGLTIVERSLQDSVRHLLSGVLPSSECVVLMDNIRHILLRAASLFHVEGASGGMHVESLLSAEELENTRRILDRRYRPLLARDRNQASSVHPLKLVLVDKLPPADITSRIFDPSTSLQDEQVVDVSMMSLLEGERPLFSRGPSAFLQWICQALHYYSLALPSSYVTNGLISLLINSNSSASSNEKARLMTLAQSLGDAIPFCDLMKIAFNCR